MKKYTVAIDIDSVLFPMNELVILPLLSARLGREVTKDEITTWSYGEIEGGKQIAYEAFKRPNLYDGYDLSVTPGAEDALAILRSQYRVITVSSPFAQHASSKWAYMQRCGFAHEDIVLCGDKGLVGFDVLVDDRPETALELGEMRVVLFDQPWNRGNGLAGFERAYDWPDVPRKIARLLGDTREHIFDTPVGGTVHIANASCPHGFAMLGYCPRCGRTKTHDL